MRGATRLITDTHSFLNRFTGGNDEYKLARTPKDKYLTLNEISNKYNVPIDDMSDELKKHRNFKIEHKNGMTNFFPHKDGRFYIKDYFTGEPLFDFTEETLSDYEGDGDIILGRDGHGIYKGGYY